MTARNGTREGNGGPGDQATTIRPARREDIPSVVSCLAAAFAPYRDSYTPAAFHDTVPTGERAERRFQEMTIFVAEDALSRIVGTIGCQGIAPNDGHLRGMAVVPGVQGRGIADRLLFAAESALRGQGCSRVTLETTRPLARAIRFYQRHGYEPTGVVSDFFGMPLFEYDKRL